MQRKMIPGPNGATELSPGSARSAGAAPGTPCTDLVGVLRSGAARFTKRRISRTDPSDCGGEIRLLVF